MVQNDLPLVSCICITGNAVAMLKRAIRCFVGQTYSNKELIAAYSSENTETAEFLKTLHDPRIIPLEIPVTDQLTLGEKRNLAIDKSNGFYFCVWDDDDWYSNFRLEFQVQSLQKTSFKSLVLERLLLYDSLHEEAYLSGTRWGWEQTLLCEKSVLLHPGLRYPALEKGEDSVLLFNLRENELLHAVMNSGLYLYVYHGKNTWQRDHWQENIFAHAEKFSKKKSALVKQILNDAYSTEEASQILGKIFRK